MSAEAFEGPDDTTSFQVERSPESFVVEGGAADERDGANGAVGLFFCSRVAPKPSRLVSQYKRKGQELSATASQSGRRGSEGWRVLGGVAG